MAILSRGERIRYATVGLIPQEGRRQDRGAELFCRNPKGEAEEARERYTFLRNAVVQENAPMEGVKGRGGGRLEIERNHGGWRSVVRGRR